jgi:hypothetical protein
MRVLVTRLWRPLPLVAPPLPLPQGEGEDLALGHDGTFA